MERKKSSSMVKKNRSFKMNEKIAKALEWVGVAIILGGVGFFAYIYFNKIAISRFHHAILLWVLGAGILCYTPLSLFRLNEKAKDADDAEKNNDSDAEIKRKAATALKRSLALKIICSVVLIAYGFLKFKGIR